MYRCKSWTRKKAEHQRTYTSELWCWRRLLRVPWTAWRSNHSILKEINPEYSLDGLMLKLKLQYFGHLMPKANSLEKTLMLGKIEGRRRRGQQGMDGITDSMDRSLSQLGEIVKDREAMGSQRVGHNSATEQQQCHWSSWKNVALAFKCHWRPGSRWKWAPCRSQPPTGCEAWQQSLWHSSNQVMGSMTTPFESGGLVTAPTKRTLQEWCCVT